MGADVWSSHLRISIRGSTRASAAAGPEKPSVFGLTRNHFLIVILSITLRYFYARVRIGLSLLIPCSRELIPCAGKKIPCSFA
jgi:hypothetical protein